MTRYGFVIDSKSCISCHSCAVACKVENNLPDTIWWNRILTDGGPNMDTPAGTYPNLTIRNIPMACQHCDNPACVKVCPVGATYKDPETGVVRQDYDKCIGCRMCMAACPYTGVRSFNWEEPQHTIDFAVGDADAAPHQKHVVEKCTMCWHRLAKGEEPMIPTPRWPRSCASARPSSCWPTRARTRPCTTWCNSWCGAPFARCAAF